MAERILMGDADISERTGDTRRRRALFRAWHRGIREADLILGRFASAHVDAFDDDEIADFERLLDVPDHDLVGWIIGTQARPDDLNSAMLDRIAAFHSQTARTDGAW